MSMNFHIIGSRTVVVVNFSVHEVQRVDREMWQTPTTVTYKILASPDPVAAYKDWVLSVSEDVSEEIFADDDIFCNNGPIGTKTVNYGIEECAELDKWIAQVTSQGYELNFFSM